MAASLSSCRCPWQTIRSSLIPNRTQRAAVALISTAMVAKPPLRRSLATSTAFSHSTNASLSQVIRWQTARRPLEPEISARHLTASSRRGYKTVQEAKARHRSGPFSWRSALLFLSAGGGLLLYFRYEKLRLERLRIASFTKGAGAPKVGGPFTLLTHDGQPFTEASLLGKYSLVYFGFTHCPDICPEELDKMAEMIDLVEAKVGKAKMVPIFITCDPARDSPAVVKSYLKEFHAGMLGLTGTWEQVKQVCKAYRVYFSTPSGVKPGMDYLVDHSIYFYLMDPQGDFVEAIGRQHSAAKAAKIISAHVGDWQGGFRQD